MPLYQDASRGGHGAADRETADRETADDLGSGERTAHRTTDERARRERTDVRCELLGDCHVQRLAVGLRALDAEVCPAGRGQYVEYRDVLAEVGQLGKYAVRAIRAVAGIGVGHSRRLGIAVAPELGKALVHDLCDVADARVEHREDRVVDLVSRLHSPAVGNGRGHVRLEVAQQVVGYHGVFAEVLAQLEDRVPGRRERGPGVVQLLPGHPGPRRRGRHEVTEQVAHGDVVTGVHPLRAVTGGDALGAAGLGRDDLLAGLRKGARGRAPGLLGLLHDVRVVRLVPVAPLLRFFFCGAGSRANEHRRRAIRADRHPVLLRSACRHFEL